MIIRFLGSAVLASGVVAVLFLAGMYAWGVFDEEERPLDFEEIRLLSARERLDLARLFGDDERVAPPRPSPDEIPRVVLPQRQVSGFVQLEVKLAPDGTVERVDVLGAAPAGVYEEEARAIVRQRRYAAPREGAPSTHIEVVDFTVPAQEAANGDSGT
ncbi:MAG: TonB family protein [Gammaproteobacteria bacterium]